ncbi:hypothetical protein [Leisingera sp. ANG-Vp]|uniref:hypothetical protein n=1 Tax=Leisingera sp. ANG-Vp TaxID=1577896 RepID=UPI0005806422|nr:hypothetical protein [Leisingera sp. ANG-Vp]KIC22066.1 hypothetical protein RA20_02165 [Leisingera sp. ANG-Vp]
MIEPRRDEAQKSVMSAFLVSVDETTERLVLRELLEYCHSISGETFDHAFSGAGEDLTILLTAFHLAKDTGRGFSGFLTDEALETFVGALPLESLPCLEDAIDVSIGMILQNGLTPRLSKEWQVPAPFSGNLRGPLRRLGLIDHDGIWTEKSIPIQIRSGFLDGTGETGSPEAQALIEEYARNSVQHMPPAIKSMVRRLHPFSPQVDRFECESVFADAWRFGHWLSQTQKRRTANLGRDLLVHHVLDQILIDRHNGETAACFE